MIIKSIYQENTILNAYTFNYRTSKYMKQKVMKVYEVIEKTHNYKQRLILLYQIINRMRKLKINKDIK